MSASLDVERLTVRYGSVVALHGVSVRVEAGETVAVLGRNGAGKTSLLRGIFGFARASGDVRLDDVSVLGRPPHRMPRLGIAYVPEDRGTLTELTVLENLLLAAMGAGRRKPNLEEVFSVFPALRARSGDRAGTLSGGQQQMLALGRAIVTSPRLLMLDEPSLGLAPTVADDLFSSLRGLQEQGVTILLVEQNARRALDLASRAYLLDLGRVAYQAHSDAILADERLFATYLGRRSGVAER